MADVIDIGSGLNKTAKKYIERVIGSALREGASRERIMLWLSEQGNPKPEAFLVRVERMKRPPTLGAYEIKNLGGRSKFREQFGLDPEAQVSEGADLLAEDFIAYIPDRTFIYLAEHKEWKEASVAERVISPDPDQEVADWLRANRHVESMTWAPGLDLLIKDRIVVEGGWKRTPGVTTLNLYHPPNPLAGDPAKADRWLDHIYRLYPNEAAHIVAWCAWRVQKPQVKINHALVLGGAPNLGKDTILAPVQHAVGTWNYKEIGPANVMGRFNGFLKAVIVRCNEMRDLGDGNRYDFYEHTKWMLASPPETFRIDEKNLREHVVPNLVGIVFTTNHKDGVYLPPDDRRHFVCWSDAEPPDEAYFQDLYDWFETEGNAHVAAYLAQPVLLEGLKPKSPPPKTEAWHEIVAAGATPEDLEVAALLEGLETPRAVTVQDLIDQCRAEGASDMTNRFGEWLNDRKNSRSIPHRLEAAGYTVCRNPGAPALLGRWKVGGVATTIYVHRSVPPEERLQAARDRAAEGHAPSPAQRAGLV